MPVSQIHRAKAPFLSRALLGVALSACVAFTACGASEPSEKATSGAAEWHAAERTALSEPQKALLGRFEAARNELASTLVSELIATVQASSHAEAIAFCKERAPAIAETVSSKNGLSIGRTSARLRNEGNAAPAWATDLLEGEADEQILARGEKDLRALFPIVVAPACLACHGKKDDLGDGVAEALSVGYPADRATGFSAGDLRGWFWVSDDAN